VKLMSETAMTSSPSRDNDENAMHVILNEVKNLMYSTLSTTQILRLRPQNDIATESPTGEDSGEGANRTPLTLTLSRKGRGNSFCVVQPAISIKHVLNQG